MPRQKKEKRSAAASKVHVIGVIDMASTGSAYLVTDQPDDIYIAPRKLGNALHGDKVKAFIYAKDGKKQGEVMEIIARSKMEFSGLLQVSDRFALLVPDNKKMLHDILIPLAELNGGSNGEKAVARITDWPKGSKNPFGKILSVLGKQGEHNTEMNAILAEFGFPLQFSSPVLDEASSISAEITDEEVSKRRDFRNETTFTIDPQDAKDFDDAISITPAGAGFRIGIHIADVSHYVRPDTALETEAYNRGTSVYLVDRVIPMLPERLSNDLCSLRPKEDKLCFSAVFDLDADAGVLSEWYGKTIIHSNHRFSYEEVQSILENGYGTFYEELNVLNRLAYRLRERRFASGAIAFETTEVKFELDASGKPLGVRVKERKDAHKLIEDFMLLANRKVAEFVAKKGSSSTAGEKQYTFVYRVHDEPKPESIATFAHFAARFGYKVVTKSHKEISKSMNKLMQDIEGTKEQNVLTQLAIRSMAKALYTTKRTAHYGLAFDYYTHFTSPIRRYPDVMVHRLLARYLHEGKSVSTEEYEPKCEQSSKMEKKASDAERASIKYKQAEFLLDKIGGSYTGVISGVTEWGMYVELNENKCEGMIRLRDLDDDFYVLDQPNYCIIGQRKKRKYQLGDELNVKIKSVDLVKKQVDFSLIR